MRSWQEQSPGLVTLLWNDSSASEFLALRFGRELAGGYWRMPPNQRKDLFMYAVLHQLGGVFADCDAASLWPAAAWLAEADLRGDRLVAGLEARGSGREG